MNNQVVISETLDYFFNTVYKNKPINPTILVEDWEAFDQIEIEFIKTKRKTPLELNIRHCIECGFNSWTTKEYYGKALSKKLIKIINDKCKGLDVKLECIHDKTLVFYKKVLKPISEFVIENIEAEVLWFDKNKGFGAVSLINGEKAFLYGQELGGDTYGNNIDKKFERKIEGNEKLKVKVIKRNTRTHADFFGGYLYRVVKAA